MSSGATRTKPFLPRYRRGALRKLAPMHAPGTHARAEIQEDRPLPSPPRTRWMLGPKDGCPGYLRTDEHTHERKVGP